MTRVHTIEECGFDIPHYIASKRRAALQCAGALSERPYRGTVLAKARSAAHGALGSASRSIGNEFVHI